MTTAKKRKTSVIKLGNPPANSPTNKAKKGFLSFVNKDELLSGLKKGGLILVGFVGGREVSRKFFPNADATGIKRYVGSILQLGGGLFLAMNKNENLKFIGYGLAASGAIEGVSKVMNKDILATGILSGLEGFSIGDIINGKTQIPVYDEREILQLELPPMNGTPEYRPSLPEISGINLDAVAPILGDSLTRHLEAWLVAIKQGKWGFKDQGERENIKSALWQMYNGQKVINENTWQQALAANGTPNSEAPSGRNAGNDYPEENQEDLTGFTDIEVIESNIM